METLLPNTIADELAGWRVALPAWTGRAFDLSFFLFVFSTIFLPGGSIYGFSYKYPLYLVMLPLAALCFFRRGLATPARTAALFGVPVVLSFWIAMGAAHGFGLAGTLRQYGDILLTFMLCWLFLVYCRDQPARRMRFLRLLVMASVATASMKIGLLVYAAVTGTPVLAIVYWMGTVFGVELMSMDLGALLGRIQFLSDGLIPISVYTVLRHRVRLGLSMTQAGLAIVALLASVVFSFSRFFWGFAAFAFALGLLLARKDRFRAVLAGVLGVLVLVSLPVLVSLYEIRFSAQVAGGSDSLRSEQEPVLVEFFQEAPLLGHGLGSYSTRLLRDESETGQYRYEVQLLALPGQIGMTGMLLIVLLAAWFYAELWWPGSRIRLRDRVAVCLLLGFWIAGGLLNPLLFHPIAGMNYAALAALAGVGGDD